MEVVIEGEPPLHYDAIVSLRISTLSIEPDTITAQLGLMPSSTHKKGDTTRVAGERVLPRRPPTENFWTTRLSEISCPPNCLCDELEKQLERLEAAREFLAVIRADGGQIEFFIGYFMRRSNTGDRFGAPLMARLAELGVGLSLDIYDPGPER